MKKITSNFEIKKMFQNKKITQFLDDSYNLSKSKKTRDVYKHILYSFNKFCNSFHGKNILETMEELKEKSLENALDVFLEYKRYLDNYTTQRRLPVSNGT